MKKINICAVSIITSIVLLLSACGQSPTTNSLSSSSNSYETKLQEGLSIQESSSESIQIPSTNPQTPPSSQSDEPRISQTLFSISDIEPYTDHPYIVVNGNIPYFTEEELTDQSYEYYSNLDNIGRCGVACASIGLDIMPTEERGEIGQIKPTGWHTVKYDTVDGNYLYNRCHLIGYQLSGENANEKNLITGTRYLNVDGMLPFENMVADYVKETENHVLYRVTPIFEGENLVATGVLMEAESVEDNGEDILFCVFVYNVQPGIIIDYSTGDSWIDESVQQTATPTAEPVIAPDPIVTQEPIVTNEPVVSQEEPQGTTYILNTNTKKFHYPSCSSVDQMKESNKQEYTGNRDDIISMGYDPCKRCNP